MMIGQSSSVQFHGDLVTTKAELTRRREKLNRPIIAANDDPHAELRARFKSLKEEMQLLCETQVQFESFIGEFKTKRSQKASSERLESLNGGVRRWCQSKISVEADISAKSQTRISMKKWESPELDHGLRIRDRWTDYSHNRSQEGMNAHDSRTDNHRNHSEIPDYHKNCSGFHDYHKNHFLDCSHKLDSSLHTIDSLISSQNLSQVTLSNCEQNQDDFPLGYRSGPLPVANRGRMLKRIKMPSFDGNHIHEWLVDIDHFFTAGGFREEDKLEMVTLLVEGRVKKWFAWVLKRGGFRDWVDFKQKLRIRFSESIIDEPETKLLSIQQTDSFDQLPHCPSEEVNLDVSGFMAEDVPETEPVRKTISQSPKAISVKFGDCHVQNHSSPELILKNDSLPALDHEKEIIKPKMISVFDNMKEVYGLSQKKLQEDLLLKKESAISVFEDLVQQEVSSNDEDYHEIDSVCASLMMQDAVDLHFEEFTGNSLLWYSPNVDLRSSSSVWHCWKNKHLQNGSLKQGMLQVQLQHKTDQIFMQKGVEDLIRDIISRKLIDGRLRQNIVNGEFKLKHKWRYKLINELFLDSVVITKDIAI